MIYDLAAVVVILPCLLISLLLQVVVQQVSLEVAGWEFE